MNLTTQIQLEEEGGITEVSLNNARAIIAARGKPGQLHFKADARKCNYDVTAFWEQGDDRLPHPFTFSGFAWGYGGTGPNGFRTFLEMLMPAAEARALVVELERRLDNDKWHCTDSSYSLDAEFLRKYGWL